MSVLKSWIGAAVAVLALCAGVHADTTVSQSNDPTAALGVDIATLLGQENSAFGLVSPARLQALVTPPRELRGKPGSSGAIVWDDAWLASQPPAEGDAEFQCLATALYFEARGESLRGQVAVGEVILNRVEDANFPDTICGVVHQGNGNGCQFSYTCDGQADRIREPAAWEVSTKIARALLDGAPRALTDGATHFHTPAVRPDWSRRFERTASIGRHIFYRAPIRSAMN
jgi:hypothetical protein